MRFKKSRFALAASLAISLMLPSLVMAAQTPAPFTSSVKVFNNTTGTHDSITVNDVLPGDVVRVYAVPSSTTAIATGTVATGQTSITLSVAQLGVAAGSVYVSVTTSPNTESKLTQRSYAAEPATPFLSPAQITITNNNTGTNDVVNVSNLSSGDVIRVYANSTDASPIGTGTVGTGADQVTISISQIGVSAGQLYVTISSGVLAESYRSVKSFAAESLSPSVPASNITITNNLVGTPDTIVITGVHAADVLSVYTVKTGGTAIVTGTVASGQTSIALSPAQLGTLQGSVYIGLKRGAMPDSLRTVKTYIAEPKNSGVYTIKVTNNHAGTNDVVRVDGVKVGDVVRVYAAASGGTAIGTTTATTTYATVSIAQISASAGKIYVTVTSTGKRESNRLIASYNAEQSSTALNPKNIYIVNNTAGTQDRISVYGLSAGDVVKVYKTNITKTAILTSTVASGSTAAHLSYTQLGTAKGTLYITVTKSGKTESARTAKSYAAES